MLKRTLLGIVALVFLLAAVGLLLPELIHVERRIGIAATPLAAFPYVNNPRNTEKWSPWREPDRRASLAYGGPAAGVARAK